MVSFLTNCPQCNATIARDSACPECQWSDKTEQTASADADAVYEFALRRKFHERNFAVFMILSIGTGVIGLTTAVLWVLVIYRGNLLAFLGIGLMTLLTGVFSVMLYFSRRWLPIELKCPGCEVRLDELGKIGAQCPACGTQLEDPSLEAEPAQV